MPTPAAPDWVAHNFLNTAAGGTPLTAQILNDDEAEILALHAWGLPLGYDLPAAKPDGAPVATDSGHPWTLSTTAPSSPFVYSSGALTLPGAVPAGGCASYAFLNLGATVRRVGGQFRFSSVQTTSGNVTLGTWTSTAVPSGSTAHLSITPAYYQFGVWNAGAITYLTPQGQVNSVVPFAAPLATDGVTIYAVDIDIDPERGIAVVTLPGGSTALYSHPLISTLAPALPFWEIYVTAVTDAVGGWTEVWADTAKAVHRAPQAYRLLAKRLVESVKPGAGPTSARPPSAQRPGSPWWDTTTGKLSASDGTQWRDVVSQAVVGNLLTPNQANMVADALSWAGQVNATVTRTTTVVPSGRSSALAITSVAAGYAQAASQNPMFVVGIVGGGTYTAVMSVQSTAPSRTAAPQLSWFDSTGAYLSSTAGAQFPLPTSGFTAALVTAVAPATAVKCVVGCIFYTPAAAGEVFYMGQVAVAPGTVAAYIEP